MWHIYDIRHLLYCNTIHPLLTSLDSVIRLGYMDDVTLDGPQDVVATDVQSVLNLGHAIGLSLNIAKCEIIITHPYGVVTYRSNSFVFCAYPVIGCRTVGLHIFPDLLRMQLGQGDVKILLAVDRLAAIRSQDALVFLRASFSAPRVQHLLRCSPSIHVSAVSRP